MQRLPLSVRTLLEVALATPGERTRACPDQVGLVIEGLGLMAHAGVLALSSAIEPLRRAAEQGTLTVAIGDDVAVAGVLLAIEKVGDASLRLLSACERAREATYGLEIHADQ